MLWFLVRPNRAEKATLPLLTAQLKKNTNRTIRQLGDVIRIVRPETVIRWHRAAIFPRKLGVIQRINLCQATGLIKLT